MAWPPLSRHCALPLEPCNHARATARPNDGRQNRWPRSPGLSQHTQLRHGDYEASAPLTHWRQLLTDFVQQVPWQYQYVIRLLNVDLRRRNDRNATARQKLALLVRTGIGDPRQQIRFDPGVIQ